MSFYCVFSEEINNIIKEINRISFSKITMKLSLLFVKKIRFKFKMLYELLKLFQKKSTSNFISFNYLWKVLTLGKKLVKVMQTEIFIFSEVLIYPSELTFQLNKYPLINGVFWTSVQVGSSCIRVLSPPKFEIVNS